MCKCSNIEDVNDLIQDTYTELYSMLKKKKQLQVDNTVNYIIGIANKKIKQHYGILHSLKLSSLWIKENNEEKIMDIPSDIDIEFEVLDNINANEVWKYIKKKDIKKNVKIEGDIDV